ncbi:hypothetical protein SDC9_99087 [bioreactor metagenome]|uniref:RNA polymerase sigma factor 70 region 4 type 2 domain-containing protein n=1 Tax=bioreactor metagenome TaxID=1076179 RepID=A0A645AHZ1_9ZZZZ
MGYEETIKQLADKAFLDKLYGFAYKRCNSSPEVEDLCSEIILSVIISLRKNPQIENFNAYVWTVAHGVYADFCKKRNLQSRMQITHDYSDDFLNMQTNPIDEFMESEEEKIQIRKIMYDISFLSKIYREVMVLYYLDEMKTQQIAANLGISETAVKQRLFSARNTSKKGATKMDKKYALKPVDIAFIGTGSPVGNDPRTKAERVLSKNVVYLCKNEALSAKEISEKLGVPMPFIEDELEIQVKGENGNYGLLRKLENGKYISNVIILDISEFNQASQSYQNELDDFCNCLIEYFNTNRKKILSFPFLNEQNDVGFIAWSLISSITWNLEGIVNDCLSKKYLKDIELVKREFSSVGIANYLDDDINLYFYGCDGLGGENLCGYKKVHFCNIYGARIEKHYGCGHNLSTDAQFMLMLKCIDGVDVNSLSESEKEVAAKAIESGLIKKSGDILRPKILVLDYKNRNDFNKLSEDIKPQIEPIGRKIADNLAKEIKTMVPRHLMNEYSLFSMLVSVPILHQSIEKCIEKGVLKAPEKPLCAEGCYLAIEK